MGAAGSPVETREGAEILLLIGRFKMRRKQKTAKIVTENRPYVGYIVKIRQLLNKDLSGGYSGLQLGS